MRALIFAALLTLGPGTAPASDEGSASPAQAPSSSVAADETVLGPDPLPFRPALCPTFRSGLADADWPEHLPSAPAPRAGGDETRTVHLTRQSDPPFGQALGDELASDLRLEPLQWPARIEFEPAPAEEWPPWSLGRMLAVTAPCE